MSRKRTKDAAAAPAPAELAGLRDRVVELRRVRAGDLLKNPKNWRRHPKEQAAAMRGLLSEVGYADALLARETPKGLMLIDGHLRAETTPDFLVPVLVLDVTEEEADKLLATVDPLAAMAETDHANLRGLLETVTTRDAGVQAMLDRMRGKSAANAPGHGLTDADAVPAAPKRPTTQPGDLWTLGPHRILCGDATVEADVARLLEGQPVQCVVTDPPYAIYGSSSGVGSEVTDDKIVRPFFEALFRLLERSLVLFGHGYVCCDWRSWSALWDSAKRTNMTARNMLVWDKGSFGLGSNYANTHELVFFVAHMPRQRTMTSNRPTGQRQVYDANVLHFDRPRGTERQHNAAKPVGLLEKLIANSTDARGRVFDPFLGSGSTLMAAERTGRVGLGMEIEPKFAEISVRRWEAFTGKKAERQAAEPHGRGFKGAPKRRDTRKRDKKDAAQ